MYVKSNAPGSSVRTEDDEIEGLNDKLLELLTIKNVSSPPRPIVSRRARSHSGTNSDPDADSQPEPGTVKHPTMMHYQYDYAFLHHGSPLNSKNPPNWLPPIGVFWDIENCQVGTEYAMR